MKKPVLVLVLALPCFPQAPPAQKPLVKGAGNYIHAVADLDQSVHFYKDILSMDVPRPAGDWQTSEAVLKMYDAGGGKFRVATHKWLVSRCASNFRGWTGVHIRLRLGHGDHKRCPRAANHLLSDAQQRTRSTRLEAFGRGTTTARPLCVGARL